MKFTGKQIIRLIAQVRAGNPPKPAEGKFEDIYLDPALPNFGIRMLHTGAAIWFVHKKVLGRQHKVTIGDVRVIDRAAATEAARDVLAKIQLRILDPQAAKREAMRTAKVTFESVVPLFLQYKKDKGIRRNTELAWTSYLTQYHFKPLHRLPIDEITGPQISTSLETVKAKSGVSTARVCHTVMAVFFKWAKKTGKLPEGHHLPIEMVERPPLNKSRERVLTNEEIRQIWEICEAWEAEAVSHEIDPLQGYRRSRPSNPNLPRAVKLLFFTGMRLREVADLQWQELDLETGQSLLSAARIKSKRDLQNPLSNLAVEILRTMNGGGDYVFTTVANGRSLGNSLGHANRLINARIAKSGGTPLARWTLHDIRRTFITRLSELGVQKHVRKALVGHIDPDKIEQTYNRDDMWPEKRKALAMWDDKLHSIITGTAPKIERPRFGQRSA